MGRVSGTNQGFCTICHDVGRHPHDILDHEWILRKRVDIKYTSNTSCWFPVDLSNDNTSVWRAIICLLIILPDSFPSPAISKLSHTLLMLLLVCYLVVNLLPWRFDLMVSEHW